MLVSMALDSSLDFDTRACCIALLGELSKLGYPSADRTLFELAKGSDGSAAWALSVLSQSDRAGQYVDLYLNKCEKQVWEAFRAASYWNKDVTTRTMQQIVSNSPGNAFPQSEMRLSAQEVLEKLQVLASPDCEKKLEEILDGSRDFGDRFPWALKVVSTRAMPMMVPALRRRLDTAEASLFGELGAQLKGALTSVATRYAAGGANDGLDDSYDDALVAFAEAGGKVTDLERMRLYSAGYACDAKQRLEELIPPDK